MRNIGIIAHIDAGKTTLTEQVLTLGGALSAPGTVEDGSTVSDWMDAEQRRGITIASAAVTCQWEGTRITVIDTPGHVDFTWEVERCLRVLDGAVLVISGPDGVQAQTQTVWHQARRRGLPVVGVLNKLDRPGYDHDAVLAEIRDRLDISPLPLFVPLEAPEGEVRLLDLLAGRRVHWRDLTSTRGRHVQSVEPLSEEDELILEDALEQLGDALASHDDVLAEVLISGDQPNRTQWEHALKLATIQGACLPLFPSVARAAAGVPEVMSGLVALLPDPEEARQIPLFDLETERPLESWPADADRSCLAYVFKTESRRHGQHAAFVRVYRGELREGMDLVRRPGETPYEVPQPLQLFGGWEDPVDSLTSGRVGCLIASEDQALPRAGETLCGASLRVGFEPPRPPPPVMGLTVEVVKAEDLPLLRAALDRLVLHDPSLTLMTDRDTGQSVLGGLGQLHLEVAVERLRATSGAEIRTGPLKARYRRTLASTVTGDAIWTDDVGSGSTLEVHVQVDPSALTGEGALVLAGSALPEGPHREALRAGLEQIFAHDLELSGLRVEVREVSRHGGGLLPQAWWHAGRLAAEDVMTRAEVVTLEPWIDLSVAVPNDRLGAVLGDLSRRRVRVRGSTARGPNQIIQGDGPLAELLNYATDLRSMTGGTGTFTQLPVGYRPKGSEFIGFSPSPPSRALSGMRP